MNMRLAGYWRGYLKKRAVELNTGSPNTSMDQSPGADGKSTGASSSIGGSTNTGLSDAAMGAFKGKTVAMTGQPTQTSIGMPAAAGAANPFAGTPPRVDMTGNYE